MKYTDPKVSVLYVQRCSRLDRELRPSPTQRGYNRTNHTQKRRRMTDIETGEAADLMNATVNCSKEVKSELRDLLVPIVKKEVFDLDSDVEKETVGSNLDVLHLEDDHMGDDPAETEETESDDPLVSYVGYEDKCFCQHCDEVLTGEAEIKEHIIMVHKGIVGSRKKIRGVYPCPHCDKSYSYPSKLNEHVVSHTHERKYFCDVCLRGFSRLGDMYKHRSKHVGTPVLMRVQKLKGEYQCFECNKVFEWPSKLKAHLPSHVRKKQVR